MTNAPEEKPGYAQSGFYITLAQKRRLRFAAVELESNISEIVREAIDEWMDRHTG